MIFQLFPRLINALQRNAVSKIIVVTPLVVIMKDPVEQLQSIGIRALAIEVDEEEAGENARLFMKVMKACCQRSGGKNNNKHIIAIAINEEDEVHSVTE